MLNDAGTYAALHIRTIYYGLGILTILHGAAWVILFAILKAKLSEHLVTRKEFADYIESHDKVWAVIVRGLESSIASSADSHKQFATEMAAMREMFFEVIKNGRRGAA